MSPIELAATSPVRDAGRGGPSRCGNVSRTGGAAWAASVSLRRPATDRVRHHEFEMAYDETLAAQIRELTADEPGLTERKMFGGLAFLIRGNMAVAASGQGGILVRVDPQESDTLVETTNAHHMVMRGKPMRGWLRVDPKHLQPKRELARWVKVGIACARSQPEKR